MTKDRFETDDYPGRPRILFVGLGESSHTHSWIDLLEGASLNVRLFALPSGEPPDDWKVRTYVTTYDSRSLDVASRARLFDKGKIGQFIGETVASVRGRTPDVHRLVAEWLARVIRQWQPHVIHTLGLEPASYFFSEVRGLLGLEALGKWVVQARGGPDLALHRLLLDYALRIRDVLEGCDQFVADNQLNYEYALACGLKAEKLSPLGCVPGTGGIDVEDLERSWSGPPSRRTDILWPKAYECPQSKALPVFEALKLIEGHLERFHIHMLAMIPETRMWFETLPEGLRRRCLLYDRIPRARALELMTRARVMLAPSLADGVPNSMYEAMAIGAVPLVSPLDTIRPVVKDEQNVLFARNLYPEEIATALVRAITDDALVDAAAEKNLALVRRIANRDEIRERVIKYYETLAADASISFQRRRLMDRRSVTSRIKNRLTATLQKASIGQKAVMKVHDFRQKRAKRLAKGLQRQLRQSEKESVDQWWNKCHSNKDFGFWLTGSNGPQVWSSLQVEDRITPGQFVLNIGVGEGHCTRALSERGCQVHALDISPVALARISNCVVATWLPSQLKDLPSDTFDVAISHLVAQHMSDVDLDQQVREVVRGLKPKGVFAMQFAFLLNGTEAEIEQAAATIKSGGICRSLESMRTLVEGAGGQIVWSEKIGTFPEYSSGWYGIHIRKKF